MRVLAACADRRLSEDAMVGEFRDREVAEE
jgi:hypothetical protein